MGRKCIRGFCFGLWSAIAILTSISSLDAHSSVCTNALKRSMDPNRVVEQCHGTCYFEATLGVIESELASEFSRPISIHRPHALAAAMHGKIKDALEGDLVSASSRKTGDFNRPKSFLNGGYFAQVLSSLKTVYIQKSRGKKLLQQERVLMEKYLERITKILHTYRSETNEMRQLFLKRVNKKLHINEEVLSKIDMAKVLQAKKRMSKKLEKLVSESAKTAKREFSAKKQILEFSSKRVNYPGVGIIDGLQTGKLNPEFMDIVLGRLSLGRSVLLAFYKVVKYASDEFGRSSLYDLPPEFESNSLALVDSSRSTGKNVSLHAVKIIDAIFDSKGNVQYFVAKDSYGVEQGDQGFIYLTPRYLSIYSYYLALIDAR